MIYGNTRAINIAEIDPQGSAEEPWEEQSIGNILKKIKTGDEQALKEAVKESVTSAFPDVELTAEISDIYLELIAEIFRFGTINRLNLDEIFSGTGDIYREVLQMESPEALENWLLKTGRQMQEMIQNGRQDTTKSFVTKAIEYVREHYADSGLNVESVCKNLSVSTAYFSTVFKKETGKTFINYLTEYRMEQALESAFESG
ncbi:MAG: AraC family transcriptional regulator [Roseburia inulinivorans]